MITEVRLKNYRSFEETTVTLEPLTVLVGRNGAGKSNFVKSLKLMKDTMTYGLDVAMLRQGGLAAFRRWQKLGQSPFDVGIGLHIKTSELEAEYEFVLGSGENLVKSEMCTVQQEGFSDRFEIRAVDGRREWQKSPRNISAPPMSKSLMLPLLGGSPGFEAVYKILSGMSFYTILPNLLQDPQKPLDDYPLDEEGRNLASVLRKFDTNQRQELNEALFRIIGDIERYMVQKSGNRLAVHLYHRAAGDEPDFELSQESDGTLRVLAILTALFQQPPRPLIVLEEPEMTIHPGAMGVLWEEIRSASQRSQIIVTTHSPDLLDMCNVNQIRVLEKENGVTRVGSVAAEQKAIVQSKLFAPGELLRAQGLARASES